MALDGILLTHARKHTESTCVHSTGLDFIRKLLTCNGLRRQNCGPSRLVIRSKIIKLAAIRNEGAMIAVEILSRFVLSVAVKAEEIR